ncbi:MAG: hypothetical protein JO270_19405 [Acidobacteriaceae bacterium]|nr:hypothetical protein [Acidobacteriaceae bacterium]
MCASFLARRKFGVVLLALLASGCVFSQEQVTPPPTPPAQPAPRHLFFAGTITELDEQHVTVSRNVAGRAPEERKFLINASTKMNKSALKMKARVTVRYQHLPEGDVALEIQIRPPAHPPKPA